MKINPVKIFTEFKIQSLPIFFIFQNLIFQIISSNLVWSPSMVIFDKLDILVITIIFIFFNLPTQAQDYYFYD